MNCPYCGNEMKKGYVEQQHMITPLEWYGAKQEGKLLWGKRKRIQLTHATAPLVAWYCGGCGKLIAEVEKA